MDVLLLVLLSFVPVKSQIDGVSLIWNGSTITSPILIYHDEITSDNIAIPTDENSNGPGDLVCRTANIGRRFFRAPDGISITTNTSYDFYQVRTPVTDPPTHPFLARLSTIDALDSTDPTINGLWTCPLGINLSSNQDPDVLASYNYIGIYSRNSGFGAINTTSISLVDPSFMADPPSFTLIGNTTGGPPETSVWTRNGLTISNGGSYSISLTVPGVNRNDLFNLDLQIFQQSRYQSTLTVTGNLPGVYVYSVINRAMSATRTASFTIEGGDITDLTAVQTGLATVEVTWTAPPGPPAGGYQITVDEASIDVTGQESPYTFTTSQVGVHTVQVTPSSVHLPGQAESVMVTVEAMVTGVMVDQLTATSVRVSWDEIPVDGITYRVYYSQTGNRKRQSTEMSMDSTTNSVDIDGLDSNVEYQFQVVAISVVNGRTIEGERSDDSLLVVTSSMPTDSPQGGSVKSIIIAVVVTFLLALLLFTIVMVIGCGIYCWRIAKTSRKAHISAARPPTDCLTPIGGENVEMTPPSIIGDENISMKPPSDYLTPIGCGNIEMGKNAAYGHLQSRQHEPPSGDSEAVYDIIN